MVSSLRSLKYEECSKTGTMVIRRTSKQCRFDYGFRDGTWFSAIPLLDMFQIDTTRRTRLHSWKLVKYQCNKNIRKFFSLTRWCL